MKFSQALIKTFKESPKEADSVSASLLSRASFIDKLAAGIYTILPLGWSVLEKISQIIREEMEAIGGQEIQMPALQPKEIWLESERWQTMDPPLFVLKDRHEKEYALGPTHEEVVTKIARDFISSYKNLPLMVYQIQNKFRNEMRSTGGLLRVREFLMKDGYSFHTDEKDFEQFYLKVQAAYRKIFTRVGIETRMVEAHSGSIGGKKSNEFMMLSETGEDTIYLCGGCDYSVNAELVKDIKDCPACGGAVKQAKAIEVAHIFNLGDTYSKKMKAYYLDKDGQQKPFVMGCYGIGLGRLMAAIVEASHDEKGIIWPETVAPYKVHLIELKTRAAEDFYEKISKAGVEVLYDDREVSAGVKFSDADLIGIPYRLVVSEKTVQEKKIEIKKRSEDKSNLENLDKIIDLLEN